MIFYQFNMRRIFEGVGFLLLLFEFVRVALAFLLVIPFLFDDDDYYFIIIHFK
jgi:hypothetical protein